MPLIYCLDLALQPVQALLLRVLSLEPSHAQAQADLDRLQRQVQAVDQGHSRAESERRAASHPLAPSQRPQDGGGLETVGGKAASQAAKPTGGGHRRGWIWGLLALFILASALTFLVWGPLNVLARLPNGDVLDWLPSSGGLGLFATATPSPTPTPTPMPSEITAQFLPQLEAALDSEDWARSVEIVTIVRNVDPAGADVQQWAYTTYMKYGRALVKMDQPGKAQAFFTKAVALAPDNAEALRWQQTTQTYLAGREALAAKQWDSAIRSFSRVHEEMPDYGDAFSRLVESYRLQGEAATAAGNWLLAISALSEASRRAPADAQVTKLLGEAYRGSGQSAMAKAGAGGEAAGEHWANAVKALLRARELLPKDEETLSLLAQAYRGQGQAAITAQDWNLAVNVLGRAKEQIPGDQSIAGLLAESYRQRGILYHQKLKLQDAKADLEAALALRPKDAEARTHLNEVLYLLSKRIFIDISEQRLYAYRGDKLVYKWPVSTGLRGRDTATGHFQVLDKIPMAYSRVWQLKMPYWLGIYYVQGIENGIHALPIRPDGSVMWGGLLGQRASYGCVILSNSAAKALYNWAEIGTQVYIRP